jgi:hypothetical protein
MLVVAPAGPVDSSHPRVNDRVENANGTIVDQVDGTSVHGGVINICSMRGTLVVPPATPADSSHPSRGELYMKRAGCQHEQIG